MKIPVPLLLLLLVPVIFAGCGSGTGKDAISSQQQAPAGAVPDCLICHLPTSPFSLNPLFTNGEGESGKHIAHVIEGGFACARCHDNYTSQTSHMNGTMDTPNSAIQLIYFDSLNPNGQWTDTARSCSNVYCHSRGTSTTASTPNIIPSWTGSLDTTCTGCHNGDSSASNKMDTGSHSKHVVSSNYDCSKCHNQTVSCSRTISNTALHVNKLVDIAFDTATNPVGAAAYNGISSPVAKTPGNAFSTCSNTYCHSNGTSYVTGVIPNNTSPTWGSVAVGCNSCHGAGRPSYPQITAAGVANPKANEHVSHMQYITTAHDCDGCHYTTTTTGNTITNPANHANGQYEVVVKQGMSYSGVPVNFTYVPDPGGVGGYCENVSCHGGIPNTAFWGKYQAYIPAISISEGTHCFEAGFAVSEMLNVTYPITYTWDFGDGPGDEITSNTLPITTSHTYANGTASTVTISGRDNSKRYFRKSQTFTPQPVANQKPTADWTTTPTVNRYTVTVTVLSSDPDYNTCGQGPGKIYITWKTGTTSQYSINLTDVASNTSYSSPCFANPVPFFPCANTYTSAGSYRIWHKVVDNSGGSSGETYVDVTLPGSTSISGKVFKSDGTTGAAGVIVDLKPDLFFSPIATTTTGADGSYSFSGTYDEPYFYIMPESMAGYTFHLGQYVYINRNDVNFTATVSP